MYHIMRLIHTLSHKACGVLTMAYILQHTRQLSTPDNIALIGHLIANAPHNNTWVVAVVVDEVHKVALGPLIEIFVVAILHLCRAPLIEGLDHKHHTHLVASLDKFWGRHIV